MEPLLAAPLSGREVFVAWRDGKGCICGGVVETSGTRLVARARQLHPVNRAGAEGLYYLQCLVLMGDDGVVVVPPYGTSKLIEIECQKRKQDSLR